MPEMDNPRSRMNTLSHASPAYLHLTKDFPYDLELCFVFCKFQCQWRPDRRLPNIPRAEGPLA